LGPKKPKTAFMGTNLNYLSSTGFGRNNRREIALWDLRNMEKRIQKIDLDQGSGILLP